MVVALGDAQQKAGFALCVFTIPACVIATVLRFVATYRSGRKPALDDWLALASLLTFLPYAIAFLYVLVNINGLETPVFLATILSQNPRSIELLKILFLNLSFFWLNQTFAKLSLLALYHRLFSVSQSFRIGVWVVAAIQIAWGISIYITFFNLCQPISKSWNIVEPGTCINDTFLFSITDPINSVLDFVVAGQAIWMLRALKMGGNAKLRLALLFSLGAFSGVIGIVKVAAAQNAVNRDFRQSIFDELQMATSVLCCCAPLYKHLFPQDINIMQKLRSWTTRSGYAKDSSHATAGSNSGASHSSMPPRSFLSSKAGRKKSMNKWMNIDDSVLAWTNGEVSRTDIEMGGGTQDGVSISDIPLRSIRIDRTVDVERTT